MGIEERRKLRLRVARLRQRRADRERESDGTFSDSIEETAQDWAEFLLTVPVRDRQKRFADVPDNLKRETAILYLDSMRRAA